VNSLHE